MEPKRAEYDACRINLHDLYRRLFPESYQDKPVSDAATNEAGAVLDDCLSLLQNPQPEQPARESVSSSFARMRDAIVASCQKLQDLPMSELSRRQILDIHLDIIEHINLFKCDLDRSVGRS